MDIISIKFVLSFLICPNRLERIFYEIFCILIPKYSIITLLAPDCEANIVIYIYNGIVKIVLWGEVKKTMRILICDDDVLFAEQLKKYIRQFFEYNHVKCPELALYSSGEALLADKGDKDILFLDIEMPGMNGIYVGNELKKSNDKIIIFIVTSYSEYLDEAMRFHVFRYLSKPLDKQRFFRNMKDAVILYNTITIKIPVETKQGVHTLPASSIIAVEAQRRKVVIHTTKCDYESVHNMQYWLNLLPKNCFFQSHRSFIVNFEHITDFDHTLIHLAENQFHAYLTRRKYSAFKETYLLYLESTR